MLTSNFNGQMIVTGGYFEPYGISDKVTFSTYLFRRLYDKHAGFRSFNTT